MMNRMTFPGAGFYRPWLGLILVTILGACATSSETPPAASATPPPIPALPFDEAVLKAANDLFTKAQLPSAGSESPAKYPLVIDPLIDGLTGFQSIATQSMQTRIEQLAGEKYPQFQVQPFSTSSVAASPVVLVGTFTPINSEGKTEGTREAYRICLALADLKSGKIVGKGTARAQMQGVNATPTRYFQDSPTWAKDPATEGYIKTCQGTKIGDPVNPVYIERIKVAALINEATKAYDAGQYRQALDLYTEALQAPGGDQLRAYNGTYLAYWKLGQRNDAAQSFGKIVDYGLANQRLAVKFLFKPGSTAFLPNAQVTGPYPIWLKQIAARTAQSSACLEISGHTSPTGLLARNDRLSLRRAESIKQRLESQEPELGKRTLATGKGSRENLVGTGKDDVSDALDRRVVFQVIGCPL
ncbi:MAG: OmpA family protein [Candidatus Competibacteraceae bacterium]|nr:OmpA family protein [Candidatus Competibacteraceae bacterium]